MRVRAIAVLGIVTLIGSGQHTRAAPVVGDTAPGRQQALTQQQLQAREHFVEATRLTQAGDLIAARAAALKGERLDPDNPAGLNLLGHIHATLGDTADAIAAYERAQRAAPGWVEPWQNLALLFVRSDRPGRALAPLDRAIEIEPSNAALHAYRGVALRATGQTPGALLAFERAWQLAPESPDLAIEVARSRQASGDLAGALAAAETAARLAPANVAARRTLARLLASSNAPEDRLRAPAALRQAIALEPKNADLWATLAGAYRSMQMHADTAAAQQRAIDLGMTTAESWDRLGQTLILLERYPEAIEAFTKAVELSPADGWLYYARGDAHYRDGDQYAAIDDLVAASGYLPGSASPLLSLINIYRVRGDNQQVDRYVAEAQATGDAPALVDLAAARLRLDQGRYAEAIEALGRVRLNDPDALEAEYLLGRALLKTGNHEEGRRVLTEYQRQRDARDAAAEEKLRGDIVQRTTAYRRRSQVFFHEGRYDKALEPLRAALLLAPEAAATWRLLLRVHEARGDDAAAAEARAHLPRGVP